MADSDTEINPRKKIKIDHNPDQNGDYIEEAESGTNTDIPKAESSQVISQNKEDIVSGIKDDATNDQKEGNEGDHNDKDMEEIGNKKLDGKVDGDHMDEDREEDDDDDDDDMIDNRYAGRSSRDIDVSDDDSDESAVSDMSSLSGEDSWKAAPAGPMAWVMKCMEDGVDPRSILSQIIPDEKDIPDVNDFTLWKLVVNLVSEPPPRDKLPDVNTLEDVIQLLQKCEKIMVLTGAGVSVSCGIPDFRSRNGIYARLAVDFPDLPDPQAMFDIRYFRRDQRPFFKFAKEIYPGQFEPSRSHKFIKLIEDHGKLLRNYTQNIDTLEQVAGIKNVIQCHGSFATATCMTCHHKCSSDDIKEQIMDQVIPMCPKCEPQTPLSVMKPDIVFFGESLPEEFHHQMSVDKDDCDLLIVIGSSLKVRPVALIPNSLPAHVPQILINKEHLRNLNFDVELLGDCDVVVGEICRRLGDDWAKIANKESLGQISMGELLTPSSSPKPSETKPGTKSDETENKVVQEQTINSENSGNVTSTSNEIEDNTDNSKASATETDVKRQCNEDIDKGNEKIKTETEKSGNDLKCESVENSKDLTVGDRNEQSEDKSVTQTETETPEPETSDTIAANEVLNENKTKSNETGQGNCAETDSVSIGTENGKVNDEVKPGCSSEDNQKPSSTSDLKKVRKMWGPRRQNVATRLGINQFCFVPPCKYIFPEAEYFTWVKSDSESDDDSGHDRDTTMDSSGDLNLTHITADSSVIDGEVIDLTTDDEDDKTVASSEETRKDPDDRDISKNSEVRTDPNDSVKDTPDTTAENV